MTFSRAPDELSGVIDALTLESERTSAMKRMSRLTALALAPAAAAAVLAAPGTGQAAPRLKDGPVMLINRESGKCLEIEGSSQSNGARAQQWDCNGQPGSFWILDGQYIKNYASGKCLEIADSRNDNGAPAQQWTCAGVYTQRWDSWSWAGKGRILTNLNSGKVLEISNGSHANGARAQQWGNVFHDTQVWSLPDGT